jgi:hypothetical protein
VAVVGCGDWGVVVGHVALQLVRLNNPLLPGQRSALRSGLALRGGTSCEACLGLMSSALGRLRALWGWGIK